ncbi:GNAT family N-acetyltransferase [Proteiniclasticum sp. BAD-10]|jgi:diamine N-acetyltransferase|uniref:GNAT family N-acetyltransferase n=1 Tax=Proteiniclasticum sediminis TaxID=2804028 RepID=A0A941HSK4_9CLOT|nr:GNAT family N-acetyltransferase [Proteiniclasticum sediminis]MBR0577332.1 GNAT family N-acetyltransferase [Proteiniclasticum sediminis]
MIELREVTIENWAKIIRLKPAPEQERFVAANSVSLAQAHFQPECRPLAVYDDDTPVGFIMYCLDPTDKEYWIFRLMIDKNHQSKGYGREAMELLLTLIRQDPEHHCVYISFEPENDWAKALYTKLGFVPDGRMVDGEVVYRLDYGN